MFKECVKAVHNLVIAVIVDAICILTFDSLIRRCGPFVEGPRRIREASAFVMIDVLIPRNQASYDFFNEPIGNGSLITI